MNLGGYRNSVFVAAVLRNNTVTGCVVEESLLELFDELSQGIIVVQDNQFSNNTVSEVIHMDYIIIIIIIRYITIHNIYLYFLLNTFTPVMLNTY